MAGFDDEGLGDGRDGSALFPFDGGVVSLSCGSMRSTEGVEGEPGVGGQEGDESLTDGTSRAEKTDGDWSGWVLH